MGLGWGYLHVVDRAHGRSHEPRQSKEGVDNEEEPLGLGLGLGLGIG